MASIPCAAYQATYIHDNLRRKKHCRMRAPGQLNDKATVKPMNDMKEIVNQWFNVKSMTWTLPWLQIQTSGPTSPVTPPNE